MSLPRTMDIAAKPIAVLQGAENAIIQRLLADFHARWRQHIRIVGAIEDAPGDGSGGAPAQLRNLTGGRSFPIFQDLGPGSTACSLDGGSLVAAGEQVRRDIAGGCDLVMLSKFGKFEAENGSGLLPAFGEAIAVGARVVTSVAPKFMAAWEDFAHSYYVVVAAQPQAIDAWWTRDFAAAPRTGRFPAGGSDLLAAGSASIA